MNEWVCWWYDMVALWTWYFMHHSVVLSFWCVKGSNISLAFSNLSRFDAYLSISSKNTDTMSKLSIHKNNCLGEVRRDTFRSAASSYWHRTEHFVEGGRRKSYHWALHTAASTISSPQQPHSLPVAVLLWTAQTHSLLNGINNISSMGWQRDICKVIIENDWVLLLSTFIKRSKECNIVTMNDIIQPIKITVYSGFQVR